MHPSQQIFVAALLTRDGQYLVVEEGDGENARLDFPATVLAAEEPPVQGAMRACLECSGYSFLPTGLVGHYVHWEATAQTLSLWLVFTGALFVPDGEPPQPLARRTRAVHWARPDRLWRYRAHHSNPALFASIEDHLAGIRYPLESLRQLTAWEGRAANTMM